MYFFRLAACTRSQKRCKPSKPSDRITYDFLAGWIKLRRIQTVALAFRPSTLLGFHRALVRRKYSILFGNKNQTGHGPKGPTNNVIKAIIELKRLNPRFGYRRIAMQINRAFGVEVDKDLVRRVLSKQDWFEPGNRGPSWLTFFGQLKDSLWSIDFFRTESIQLKTHWVMVIMDQYTRRIIGFAVHKGSLNGCAICQMFNRIIYQAEQLPIFLSSDK